MLAPNALLNSYLAEMKIHLQPGTGKRTIATTGKKVGKRSANAKWR